MASDPLRKPSTSTFVKIIVVMAVLAALWFSRVAWDYFDLNSPANVAVRAQLKLFGTAIYEYHSNTGHWPSTVDDFAQTMLPARSHVWRQTATAMVFLWPQNLNLEPKDNANVLLAYWNAGLYNRLGKVWVCWGDLRTQRLDKSELRKRITAERDP